MSDETQHWVAIGLALMLSATSLVFDNLLQRRVARQGRHPTWTTVVAVMLFVALVVLGKSWLLLVALGGGVIAEHLFPRQRFSFWSAERFRAAVYTGINIAVVGTVQALVFGLVVTLKPTSWGLASLGAPLFVQVVLFLLVNDFKNYWFHRLDHRVGFFWRFHKIHHADSEVSILSPRDHISYSLEKLFTNIGVGMLLGVRTEAYALSILIWQAFVQLNHLNVVFPKASPHLPWSMRFVVTPTFHAWHHTEQGAHGVNLSDMFPVWDFLFGTAEAPTVKVEEWRWGLPRAERLPSTVAAQLASPFFSRDAPPDRV